ncbi:MULTISPECIES: bifunctional DNA-formamidopyrimidine glycosylase/DNA-(apurinic or apyrimidinic site) lyase [Methylosinus]|uniref:Formamidopyrimidine-DNA glycosylase n=1 Tax=Methylosinus trichosporium (strain ATCC 35070 / NCIMB 11131 / UNIQEM 75 / OB3b) TaxID=595536 RepID=A0A2D2D632_METT3|nr:MULTISPECIES: bifunctional DNA-formamidopyrimidine glycosylase/DNA-(apurinic or apyrimidinic site) lyase [Methylosinus]ATQ70480.1 bifunctional DNA-formamidopyrimidine glycosylase/DNA-(apurinic or apyrimidinic site) lyase [Methylosinus trichosporium OB3b]OBS53038.1 DNA-formamidopyrimidine glycosylase [Methylosinus sp. 3S-1]
MPELPEVETVRRGLEPVFTRSPIERVELRRADLRFPFPPGFAARLAGRRVLALGRRAKYLIGEIDGGDALIMHLGMSGSFRIDAADPEGVFHRARDTKAAHDHVVLHFSGGARVTYNDPRRFGFMLLVPRVELAAHPLFVGLGVEPLGPELTPETLAAELAGRKAPLKAALLDQRTIAGLGNIYVCEALHRAHLSPLRAAGGLVDAKGRPKRGLVDLVRAIREVLGEAIEAGGSSLRDHRQTDGSLGYFQHSFRVYDREDAPCPTPGCRGQVSRIAQSGRSTFFCRDCQK